MNVKWDSNECEERFNNLNDNEKKLLLELKDKGGKLMLLASEIDKLIKEVDKSSNEDVSYIMCNELSLECIEDFMVRCS